jgi:hypothetical protein
MYLHCTLLWSIQLLPLLFLTLLSTNPHFSTAFNTYPYILYFTDAMFYNTVDELSFSFPFPSSLSSREYFHHFKYVVPMSLYMNMLVFVNMFIFLIYLPYMREKMWPLFFWAWLTSLTMMSSNCIHLPSNHMIMESSKEISQKAKDSAPGHLPKGT